ncbi:MAG: NADPH-dependent F420 reductase [Solirubrobacteraceae bacterium]|nr:NADPH-dependent F420 reductase [Patulibacter sp.]
MDPAPQPSIDVAVVGGTGDLGYGVASRLAAAGKSVVIGSRAAERAQESAATLAAAVPGSTVTGAANEDAVASAALVVLAVPFSAHASTLKGIAKIARPGQVFLDATVPLAPSVGGRPTRLVGVWQGSAAEQVRELLPDTVHVVSGLHTISAASLTDLEHVFDEDVLLCGDDAGAKQAVSALITTIPGLRPVDCGKLDSARLIESLTPLLIGLNIRNKTHTGIRIVGLPTKEHA